MKKSDMKPRFLSVALTGLGVVALASSGRALPLDTSTLSSGTRRGVDADNAKIQCSFNLSSIRQSPSNQRYRHITVSHNGNTWELTDFDPKPRIPLVHYNSQGWYGYDVWFRSYTSEQPFARIWMNYMTSKRVPVSVQLYAVSKKTGITRLFSDCTQLR